MENRSFSSLKFAHWVVWWLLSATLIESQAMAYLSFARHGYTTCVTCHYSPSGAGLLTPYGKFIAGELLGTFNDSSSALPWLVNPQEDPKFVAMVLARGAQTYFNTPQVTRSDFRKMQFDFEGGLVHDGWQALGTFGPRLDAAIEGMHEQSSLTVRRFWLGKVSNNYAVRAGKFFPEFGLNHFNHNIPTRKGLYFNHNEEPYNLQASHFTDTFDYTLSWLKGAEETQLEGKQGYSGTVSYKVGTNRFGASNLAMRDAKSRTSARGVFLQSGYLGHGFTLAEFTLKSKQNARGHASLEELGYLESGWEIHKGVTPYLAYEYSRYLHVGAMTQTPEFGIQLNPITHVELILQAGKSFINIPGRHQKATHGFAMLNLYF